MTLKRTIKEFATYLGDRESILDRDYPRVAGQIELLWGYVEFYRYLEKLLITEKGGIVPVFHLKQFWSSIN